MLYYQLLKQKYKYKEMDEISLKNIIKIFYLNLKFSLLFQNLKKLILKKKIILI